MRLNLDPELAFGVPDAIWLGVSTVAGGIVVTPGPYVTVFDAGFGTTADDPHAYIVVLETHPK
jgi:hypothetical protein